VTSPYAKSRRRHIGFKALADRITGEYRRKGYSPTRARKIGQATAGKVANNKRKGR
jgi:hypothetical protein